MQYLQANVACISHRIVKLSSCTSVHHPLEITTAIERKKGKKGPRVQLPDNQWHMLCLWIAEKEMSLTRLLAAIDLGFLKFSFDIVFLHAYVLTQTS